MYRKVLIAALIGAAFTVPGYAMTATHMTPIQTHPSVLPSLLVKRYYAVTNFRHSICWVRSTNPEGTSEELIGSATGYPTRALAQHEADVGCYFGGG